MPTCIIIPTGRRPLARAQLEGLLDYWLVLDGFTETVEVTRPLATLLVSDDRADRRLPVNHRATAFWWLLTPEARGGRRLRGEVILTSAREGEPLDPILELLLLEAGRLTIEVRLTDDPTDWWPTGRTFTGCFSAAIGALETLERINPPEDVRVTAVR